MAKEAADAASQAKDGELLGRLKLTFAQNAAASTIFDTLRDRLSFQGASWFFYSSSPCLNIYCVYCVKNVSYLPMPRIMCCAQMLPFCFYPLIFRCCMRPFTFSCLLYCLIYRQYTCNDYSLLMSSDHSCVYLL